MTPGTDDDAWARQIKLQAAVIEAVRAGRDADIERGFRQLLAHRARFRLAPARDIPATLALVDLFEREGKPAPSLLDALLHTGLDDGRGGELRDLSRLLLGHRDSFTRPDFDFLASRLADLAARTGVPSEDFLKRVNEQSAPAVPGTLAGAPSLVDEGRWFVVPTEGRAYGVAVDFTELLAEIGRGMEERGLLKAGDEVRGRAPLPAEVALEQLEIVIESGRWAERRDAIESRYRLKTGLVVLCAALAAVMAVLAVALQVRRFRLLELRSAFVSTVSHELRTPLASIRLLAETVARRAAKVPALKDYPERIVREVDALTFLVENILSFNRLEKGRLVPRREPQALDDVVADVQAEIELQATRPVIFEVPPPDAAVEADPELLKLLLMNLARNAYLYNDRDPVRISISHRTLGEGLEILVGDNGRGIPEDERRRIFDEFYRPHENVHQGGTGLGLAICRRVMELHRGSIEIADSGPEGSTFRLHFPEGTVASPLDPPKRTV